MVQVLRFSGCFRSTQPTVQRRGRDLEIAPTEEYKISVNDYCPVSTVPCHVVCDKGITITSWRLLLKRIFEMV